MLWPDVSARAFQLFGKTFRKHFGDITGDEMEVAFGYTLEAVKARQKREQFEFGETLRRFDDVYQSALDAKRGGGQVGSFLGFHELFAPAFMRDIERRRAEFENALTPSIQHRIENGIDESIALSFGGSGAALRREFDNFSLPGNAALEQGTAAAFSQEKRSQQQNQALDLQKQSVKELKEQTKALHRIDQNMGRIEATEAANFTA